LSKQTLSLTGTTPLGGALQYLIVSNNKTGVKLSTCNPADQNRLRQRFAYLALIYSNGKQGQEAAWFPSSNECDWKGITCNANKTVTKLNFYRRILQGIIPADVGLWTGLTNFIVGFNQLVGSLPSSIGAWTGLTEFDVSNNQLTGTVPNDVSNWTSIKYAYLEGNMFKGKMPVIGNLFCPATTKVGQLWADCKSEIECDCCNSCFY
jgi:Leucine-rich repeat (LRR) protein